MKLGGLWVSSWTLETAPKQELHLNVWRSQETFANYLTDASSDLHTDTGKPIWPTDWYLIWLRLEKCSQFGAGTKKRLLSALNNIENGKQMSF